LCTNVVLPILWLGDDGFTEGVRARDLKFVQDSRSVTHIQPLEAEGIPAEVVDDIAEPTRRCEGVSGRGEEGHTLARSSTRRGRSLGSLSIGARHSNERC
jgi:hypothetical protein